MGACASIGMVDGISNEEFEERVVSIREVLGRASVYTIESNVQIYGRHGILKARLAGLEAFVRVMNEGRHPEWWPPSSINHFDSELAVITTASTELDQLLLSLKTA